MNNDNQLTREARSYAGFYLRTGSRTWFWGWGSPPTAAAEQRWAGVAGCAPRQHLRAATTTLRLKKSKSMHNPGPKIVRSSAPQPSRRSTKGNFVLSATGTSSDLSSAKY